jgi:hypothetical protein
MHCIGKMGCLPTQTSENFQDNRHIKQDKEFVKGHNEAKKKKK